MSSNTNESSVNQPEDSNRVIRNRNQMNHISLRNPTLGDYFRNNEDIRNKGYVDNVKLQGIV